MPKSPLGTGKTGAIPPKTPRKRCHCGCCDRDCWVPECGCPPQIEVAAMDRRGGAQSPHQWPAPLNPAAEVDVLGGIEVVDDAETSEPLVTRPWASGQAVRRWTGWRRAGGRKSVWARVGACAAPSDGRRSPQGKRRATARGRRTGGNGGESPRRGSVDA